MRALARFALALAGLFIIVTFVSSIAVTTATQIVPTQGGTYIEGLVGQPGLFNPLAAPANRPDNDIAALVFSGLTRRDDQGHVIPDLAERWDVSADARVYTFVLRRGARWHDGTPVTANDVIYTVEALKDEEFRPAPWLTVVWGGIRAEKIDDRTVRLTLPYPYAPFLQYTSLGLLPAHLLSGRGEPGREAYTDHPIGTGPYRLSERNAQHTILEAFDAGPGSGPMIPRLAFRYFSEEQAALSALLNGEVMAVADVTLERARQLERQAGITVHWLPRASQAMIFFNLSLPFFEDADVRRALSAAIDRRALVQTVLDGKAQPSYSLFLSTSWMYTPATANQSSSQDAARLLLDKAGWQDSDRDGIRDHNGVRLEFALLTNDDPVRIQVAQAVARAWTDIGAAVEVQVINAQSLVLDYIQPRRFEALLFGWAGIRDDPDPYEMWHSSQRSGTGLNLTGFASQHADELLEQARRTADQTMRKALYTEFQAIIADQLPAIVLYEPQFAFAISNNVHSVRLSFITESGDRFRHLSEWYLMTRKVTVTEKQRVR